VIVPQGWRLVRAPYADLSGEGARRYGGRWNSPGRAAVYLSENAALPVLEVLVHLDLPLDLIPADYVLLCLDLKPVVEGGTVSIVDGPVDAMSDRDSRAFGDDWLETARTPLLSVRSTIVPECRNLILNPAHPHAARLPAPTTRPFAFDPRLFDPGGRAPGTPTPPRP